ncbi:hypothetical protein [Lacibacter sp.]|uniref:hypothetical protein n=1 Tax=Lacibacter sp. TaxID=1915409 RepID=UPI002B4AC452|nr:hypothetical protein [Lacibacter sp.]HLP39836.1 hypothetical protein [Lacibacter sp.]
MLLRIGLLFSIVVFLDSCFKKGEDDPFVSLRTRKDRVAGKWRVTSINKVDSSSYGDGSQVNKWFYKLNGGEYIDSYTFVFNNQVREIRVKKGKRTLYYEFDKNRNYRMYDYTDDDTTIIKGKWGFNDKSEYIKKKIAIYIYPSETYSTSMFFDGNLFVSQWSGGQHLSTIRELRHRKMVWEDYAEYKPDISGTNHLSSFSSSIVTLEPQ